MGDDMNGGNSSVQGCEQFEFKPCATRWQEQQLRDKLDEERRRLTSSRIRLNEQQKEANRDAAAAVQVWTAWGDDLHMYGLDMGCQSSN